MKEKNTSEEEMFDLLYKLLGEKEAHIEDIITTIFATYQLNDEKYKEKLLTLAAEEYIQYIAREEYLSNCPEKFIEKSNFEIVDEILDDLKALKKIHASITYYAINKEIDKCNESAEGMGELNKKISGHFAEIVRRNKIKFMIN